jgi:protein gp37
MSKIEWTDKTWNPIIGCTKISEGCNKCYAEKMAYRLATMESTRQKYQTVVRSSPVGWNGRTYFEASELEKPLKWKKPKRIFVCSMGDLFHESVPFEWIDKVFAVTTECLHHTFQVLTKRPDIMKRYFESRSIKTPYLNVWLGVTTENQQEANERIITLLEIPAAKRFVSCEPLLSHIDLYPWLETYILPSESMRSEVLNGLDWVIAGPETGPGKRPMKKEWVENIYNQCKNDNVPFFDKKNILELNLKEFPNE